MTASPVTAVGRLLTPKHGEPQVVDRIKLVGTFTPDGDLIWPLQWRRIRRILKPTTPD